MLSTILNLILRPITVCTTVSQVVRLQECYITTGDQNQTDFVAGQEQAILLIPYQVEDY